MLTQAEMGLNKQRMFLLAGLASLLLLTVTTVSYMSSRQKSAAARLEEQAEQLLLIDGLLNESTACLAGRFLERHSQIGSLVNGKEILERERIYAGGGGPLAFLTIDDGPSENTLAILDILAEYDITATFFVIYTGEIEIYHRIVREGHTIGNHTYTHNYNRIYQSVEGFMKDLLRLEEFLHGELGIRPDIIRFPGGSSNRVARQAAGYDIMPQIIEAVTGQGYDYFDWNVSSGDGNPSNSPDQLFANVVSQVERQRGGNIVVLLHDSRYNHSTVIALPYIIDYLESRGYLFLPLRKGAINVKHR